MSDDTTTAEPGTRPAEAIPPAADLLAPAPASEFAGTPDNPYQAPDGLLSEEIPAQKEAVGPVAQDERVRSVDVLRGVALLGILAMNIVGFGWPMAAYSNPLKGGGFEGLDRALWTFNHLAFEGKMMTLFSMLFGAGLVLMGDRAEAKGKSIVGFYYRRVTWLLVIGLIHAYLIWNGDILVLYAQCGFILFLFRRLSAKWLLTIGVAFLLILVPVVQGLAFGVSALKSRMAVIAAKEQAGEKLGDLDKRLKEVWKHVGPKFTPNPERSAKNFQKELDVYRGSYAGIVRHRAPQLITEHTFGFVLGGFWMAASRMLIGMGLMKLGVFSGERSRRFYLGLMACGYGIGLPLVAYDAYALAAHEFRGKYMFFEGGLYPNYFGSVLVALGHVGLVMLICKAGVLRWLTDRLAAAGRMALSNYLFDSIACTFLFYGYGLGYFGSMNRTGLYLVVLAIWAFQLLVSPIWLRHYRFGPAEWAWRSLTYGTPQPMRQPTPEATPLAA